MNVSEFTDKKKALAFAVENGIALATPATISIPDHVVFGKKISVTDPCYEPDIWCAASVDCKPGKYNVFARNVPDECATIWSLNALRLAQLRFGAMDAITPENVSLRFSETCELFMAQNSKVIVADIAKSLCLALEMHFGIPNDYISRFVVSRYLDAYFVEDKSERELLLLESCKDACDLFGSASNEHNITDDRMSFESVFKRAKDSGFTNHLRAAAFWVVHSDYAEDVRFLPGNVTEEFLANIEPEDVTIGVDSGQCGMFDHDLYSVNQKDEALYRAMCAASCQENSDTQGGIVTYAGKLFGYNSSAGYGDGSYQLRCVRDDLGKVIFAHVQFISETPDDEDEVA